MTERNYVLGTHDAEIDRLRLQHRVWRPRMLDAWRRAGITEGQTVIDVGSGPGYASLDLAEIVGPRGRIIAVERSARFLAALRDRAKHDGIENIETIEADITETPIGDAIADAAWCRWVFSWLTHPERAVANIARAMKPAGIAIFHEYLDYGTWGLAPRSEAFSALVQAIIDSVSKTGADIDSARQLPRQLEAAGFDILSLNPIVDIVDPQNYVWQWPTAFARGYHQNLVADGLLTEERARKALAALTDAENRSGTRMITPIVLEIIARRR
ncbi:MAG: methyltransferase domain-containing protein [Alphaproteobacteria bacterium]|nr:methyltransferase domain-containing protein [Alphaproteobacteria bacterium]